MLTAIAVGTSGVLAACSDKSNGSGSSAPAKETAAPVITYRPANGATDVVPTSSIGVDVTDGWFQKLTLTNGDGKVVAAVFNKDRTSFNTAEPLGFGATYTFTGSVVGRDGKSVPVSATFTTVNPTKQVNGQFQLADGQTVGIAAPIILQFDSSISDKASVERNVKVVTEPPVEGSWAWLPDEREGARMHWRPREYYPPGTKVSVSAKLYGVPFGDDAYGAQDSTLEINIGRRQVVKADATSHRIQVITDGGVLFDFPCSYGEADKPRNVTRSGTHVVTEKYADFWMSNPAAGYSNVHERWAVRISNNGEFIHANPASSGAQGNTNVTNGCINLSTDNAQQYFQTAIYGDPVEVTGTSIQLSYADGDIWDWAVDWDTWLSMSALPRPNAPRPETSIPQSAPATPTDAPTYSGTPTTTTTPPPTGPATTSTTPSTSSSTSTTTSTAASTATSTSSAPTTTSAGG
ncbi:Ig-like domain-containing protein [Mycolicibacterium sp. lyk4-40-TYG-92]|uniref:L,D-transpeptidase n=1 Tax=Mycolicibacterium sp. lyk4-40-TYG-92 TaxID=3040295 RepID=UPI00254E657F|nr:Ig-like domain-containing protein [Mycolicibacterium sp. lyk4-40-TYG-92]